MNIKKSRIKNNIKRNLSKKRKMLKGGDFIKPNEDEMLFNINKDYVNYIYSKDLNILKYQNCPHLIKFNNNINIISIHHTDTDFGNIDEILDKGIENTCVEIINHPSIDEKIYFFYEKKNNFECLDFTTLFQKSYKDTIIEENISEDEKKKKKDKFYHTCQNEIAFPCIEFFYCDALKLSYWQKIYDSCNLQGKKLNIFTFHLSTDAENVKTQQKIIEHYAKENTINFMIVCGNAGSKTIKGYNNDNFVKKIIEKTSNVFFIGFSRFITTWGSNLLARIDGKSVEGHLEDIKKIECNKFEDHLNYTINYYDKYIKAKYTQDIIISNIKDMLTESSQDIQFVDEQLCASINKAKRVEAKDKFTCPIEIKYNKTTPRELIQDQTNRDEILFRKNLLIDIQKLKKTDENTVLESNKNYLKKSQYIHKTISDLESKYNLAYSQIPKLIEYFENYNDDNDSKIWNILDYHEWLTNKTKKFYNLELLYNNKNIKIHNLFKHLSKIIRLTNYYKISISIDNIILTKKDNPLDDNTIHINNETGNVNIEGNVIIFEDFLIQINQQFIDEDSDYLVDEEQDLNF
jgi:hypothetical protein